MHKCLTIQDYTDELGSSKPSPGGGSAAAMVTAHALALCEMVCRLNSKRKKSYANHWKSALRAQRFNQARTNCLNLSDEDTSAFEEVSKHWKNGGSELQIALKNASQTPFKIAHLIQEYSSLASLEIEPTSKHLISDLSEAGHFFAAGYKSALMNIKINLYSIDDVDFVRQQETRMNTMSTSTLQQCQNLIQSFAHKYA